MGMEPTFNPSVSHLTRCRKEGKKMKAKVCEKCGAPLKEYKCEYCGTEYEQPEDEINDLKKDLLAAQLSMSMANALPVNSCGITPVIGGQQSMFELQRGFCQTTCSLANQMDAVYNSIMQLKTHI